MLEFYVIKANGEKEIFDFKKLENSLKKVGTKEKLINEVVAEISKYAFDGITTSEIYRKAYSVLRRKYKPVAARYSLRKAVGMLGPTGFPFEKFVAEIFKAQGYQTKLDTVVKGKCVEHEIDVIAWKDDQLIMTEAKFHADFNLRSDLKVVLYIKARYDDIFGKAYNFGGQDRKLTEGWIVTNTKFSSTAIQYGECQPILKFVGWNYPYDNNLHDLIEKYDVIPLTALTTLTLSDKNLFLAQGVVLSKTLLDTRLLKTFGFDDNKIKSIQTEVTALCDHCKEQFKN
jgi:hypothetical protein